MSASTSDLETLARLLVEHAPASAVAQEIEQLREKGNRGLAALLEYVAREALARSVGMDANVLHSIPSRAPLHPGWQELNGLLWVQDPPVDLEEVRLAKALEGSVALGKEGVKLPDMRRKAVGE